TISQVTAVKKLCLSRTQVSHRQILPYLELPAEFSVNRGPGYPPFANPVFTMIISRHMREKEGQPYLTDDVTIYKMMVAQRSVYEAENRPDAMVLGNGVVGLPVIPVENQPLPLFTSPFFEPTTSQTHLLTVPSISFGIGLMLLL